MGESAKRKQENPRNANLAAWYSFDPSNIWWLMDGVKHPQSRAPSAGLKTLSCCFRFIWQSARGKQVSQCLIAVNIWFLYQIWSLTRSVVIPEFCLHQNGLAIGEGVTCTSTPLSWLHITSILRIPMGRRITYTDSQYIKSTGSTCAPCVLSKPEWS